jgi:outer membrane protein assembly factor BamA
MGKVKVLFILLCLCGAKLGMAQMVVQTIEYSGMNKTKIPVIMREMPFVLGDTIVQAQLDEFENRLRGLGLFTKVNISLTGQVLNINALEKLYIWAVPTAQFADANFSQWFLSKDIRRLALGANVYLKNLGGLDNQLMIAGKVGFNSSLALKYEKVPQGTNWNMGYFAEAKAGFNAQQKMGLFADELLWDNRNKPHFFYETLDAGLLWRKGLYHFVGLNAGVGRMRSKEPNARYAILGADSLRFKYTVGAEYVLDSRVQRHFPLAGFYAKVNAEWMQITGKTDEFITPVLRVKFNKFYSINKSWLLRAGYVGAFQKKGLPFYFTQALGADREYLRGFEPNTFMGSGYNLGRISLAYALKNGGELKLAKRKYLGNYAVMPFSVWCSIFAEKAAMINPIVDRLSMSGEKLYSLGFSLEILTFYNSMFRADLAINGDSWLSGNMSFRNAF